MPVQVFDGSQPLLLGQPFLRGMHYQIDNSANYLHFTRDQKDLQKQMSYDSVEVPFQMQNGNLMVSAKVNGNPVELNFDTGAPHNVFTLSQMERFSIEPYAQQLIGGVGGSAVVGYRARVDSMELGPIKKTNVECLISPAIGHGLVGQEFFGHMRYVIDNEKHVIRFAR
jgi:predicted aspartyl protease